MKTAAPEQNISSRCKRNYYSIGKDLEEFLHSELRTQIETKSNQQNSHHISTKHFKRIRVNGPHNVGYPHNAGLGK